MARALLDDVVDVHEARSEPRTQALPSTTDRSPARPAGLRTSFWMGWLFVAPALLFYGVFVLRPLVFTFWYSLYR